MRDGPSAPSVPRVPFLYLRHGETDWNAAGRAQGRSDIPLNALGRAQAEQAGSLLRGQPVARVVASPLARADETARIVARAIGIATIAQDEGLREVSFGVREGGPMGRWYEDWIDGLATPEQGESFAALGARGAGVLARHLGSGEPAGMTLFVAHGALFRAIRAVLGLPIHVRLANGAPMRCRPDAAGWTIEPVALSSRASTSLGPITDRPASDRPRNVAE